MVNMLIYAYICVVVALYIVLGDRNEGRSAYSERLDNDVRVFAR